MNKQLKLFTISVGTGRFSHESVKQNIAMFHDKKLNLRLSLWLAVIPDEL
jgi:hypothetical protein